MAYTFVITKRFDKTFKKNVKKDGRLKNKTLKKIDKICQNPFMGKPLKRPFSNKRRERVNGFIIIYEIKGEEIIFHVFEHHNYAYQH